jgi:hypothetical protein
MSEVPRGFSSFANIDAKPVNWLWQDRIPLGELTLLDGDSGCCKTSLLIDLAARITTGQEMPDGTPTCSGGVVIVTVEDSKNKSLRPKLDAAGADIERCLTPDEYISIPKDIARLEEAVVAVQARLLVIDPISSHIDARTTKEQEVRKALLPLRAMAERRDLAVVLVRHLAKAGMRQALYRGLGSVGIVAVSRAALLVAPHPDETNLRVLAVTKNNLAEKADSMIYEPVSHENSFRLSWRGRCDLTADDLLKPPTGANKLDEAKAWLLEILIEGPLPQEVIFASVPNDAFAYRTVERAKAELGVRSHRKGFGRDSEVFWELP